MYLTLFVLFVYLSPWVSPTARNIEPLRGSSGTLRVRFFSPYGDAGEDACGRRGRRPSEEFSRKRPAIIPLCETSPFSLLTSTIFPSYFLTLNYFLLPIPYSLICGIIIFNNINVINKPFFHFITLRRYTEQSD